MRQAEITRKTKETDIALALTLEGKGSYAGKSGCGFLDHMLELLAWHGRFNLQVTCTGDTWVDDHHTVEDIGIAFGQALCGALGDKRGICRYGSMLLPMDEALSMVVLDISGRPHLTFDVQLPAQKVGTFDTELVKEFFLAVAREAGLTLHVKGFAGENTHHIIESVFKGFGRALRYATAMDEAFAEEIPSSKGTLGKAGI